MEPERTWRVDDSGDWNDGAHWFGGEVPNANTAIAILGNATTSPQTLFANVPVTVKTIQFGDSTDGGVVQMYAIAGSGSVNLDADVGNATIDVIDGSHQFQTVVNLNTATDVSVAEGAFLSFNNGLNLNGFVLTKTGSGTMAINNALNTGGGSVVVSPGALGGSGEVVGDLTNNGGTVTPGNSPGELGIAGNYLQTSGSLEIEINGAEAGQTYDVLSVNGDLTISGGSLDIGMGFTPTPGDTFDVLDFSTIDLLGATLNLGMPGANMVWDSSQLSVDGSLTALSALPGDMDGDLAVTTADASLFIQALVNRAAYDANGFFVVSADFNADMDASSTFDLSDLAPFNELFAGSASAVPEPSTLSLAVILLMGIAIRRRRRV